MNNNPYSKYTSTSLTTGSEAQQLIAIYDGILKFLYQARKCSENGDIEGKFKNLEKVSSIFVALQSGIASIDTASVNNDADNEMLKSLNRFYVATALQVNKINMQPAPTEELSKFIEQIRKVRDATVQSAQNEGLI